MKARHLALGLIVGLSYSVLAQTNSPPVRLAVIGEDPSLGVLRELLTVELSQQAHITLLERSEIDRVYREQGLSAANLDYIKLGQLLGADGLLLLELSTAGVETLLSVRLVAVGPGVIVYSSRFPWPISDPNDWVRGLARALERFVPKLNVPASEAVPLSLVSLQTPLTSPEAGETTALLSSLLIDQFSREKELFVLERQRMELLLEEKELQLDQEASFWNSAYLLDGVVDRDGYADDTVTLNARLTPPNGAPSIQLEAAGARRNLVEVVNRLCDKVVSALRIKARGGTWSPDEEAGRFLEEAQWDLRWGMFDAAAAAAESSWALGNQTADVALLRHTIYQKIIDAGYEEVPVPAKLALTLRQLQNYRRDFVQFSRADAGAGKVWYELGIDSIKSASGRLQRYYYMPEAREGCALELADLRTLCRETVPEIKKYPGFTNLVVQGEIPAVKARFGWLWQETPEGCVRMYQRMLDSGEFGKVRERAVGWGGQEPMIGGWQWKDRRRAPEVWGQFVDDLCDSTNLPDRIDGLFLRCASAPSDSASAETLRELLDLCWMNRDAILAPTYGTNLTQQVKPLVKGLAATAVWKEFETQFASWSRELKASEASHRKMETIEGHITTASTFDLSQISKFLGMTFTAAEAEELIPLVEAYGQRIQTNKANRVTAPSAAHFTKQLLAKLESALSAPAPGTTPPRPSTRKPPSQPLAGARSEPRPRGSNPNSSLDPTVRDQPSMKQAPSLEVRRFWRIPDTAGDSERLESPSIGALCYRDDRVWLEIRYESSWNRPLGADRSAVARVDPASLKAEVIPVGGTQLVKNYVRTEQGEGMTITGRPRGQLFEVHQNRLYFSTGKRLRAYSFEENAWSDLPMPFDGYGRLVKVGARLFCTTPDSIFEVLGGGEPSMPLLASTRRRPAEGLLDELPGLNWPWLWEGPDGAVRTLVHGNFYNLKPGSDAWEKIDSLPDPSFNVVHEQRGLIASSKNTVLLGITGSDPACKVLLIAPSKPASPFVTRTSPASGQPSFGQQRWDAAPGLPVKPASAQYDGTRLWLVSKQTRKPPPDWITSSGEPGQEMLLVFKPGRKSPVTLPLKFRMPAGVVPRSRSGGAYPRYEEPRLEYTPAGLFLIPQLLPGLWQIPSDQLESAIAEAERISDEQEQTQRTLVRKQQQELLEKYDSDEDGTIENEERQKALLDSAYLAFERTHIDTNGNRQLDSGELKFFDADDDWVLDENEAMAIERSYPVLAALTLQELDINQDDQLDRDELQPTPISRPGRTEPFQGWERFDRDRNRQLSESELIDYMHWYTDQCLPRPRPLRAGPSRMTVPRRSSGGSPRAPTPGRPVGGLSGMRVPGKPLEGPELFRARVELYWQQAR